MSDHDVVISEVAIMAAEFAVLAVSSDDDPYSLGMRDATALVLDRLKNIKAAQS